MIDEPFEDEEFTEGSDDYKVDPSDFAEIFVIPSDWTVSTLRQEMDDIIDLDPEFQRRSVWSIAAKSKFIESLILGIPIPQILMAEAREERNRYLVLDGKQRLLTISEFFKGCHSNGAPFKLSGLDDLKHLNGCTWDTLLSGFPREARSIEGAQIRTAIIRGWRDDNVLYEIFHRLNSGSVRLSPMELRMALIRGPFIKWVINRTASSEIFLKILRLREPDKRMKDVEIAIRHLAFQADDVPYEGNLKIFLDDFCRLMNRSFDGDVLDREIYELEEALRAGMMAFSVQDFCSKYNPESGRYEGRFNRAIFDVLVGSLKNHDVRAAVHRDPSKFADYFKKICENPDFIRAVEVTTKTVDATRTRFHLWYSLLNAAYGTSLVEPVIRHARDHR